jgi:hypothetical protein
MLSALVVGVLAGVHSGLSAAMGYAVRAEAQPTAQATSFAAGRFLLVTVLVAFALATLLFFAKAIPAMGSDMVLIAWMLRRMGKGRRKRTGAPGRPGASGGGLGEKQFSTIAGGILALIVGLGETALGMLLTGLWPSGGRYSTLLRWPAILSIDGIALLWLTLNPLIDALAGAQAGYKLGQQVQETMLYWY